MNNYDTNFLSFLKTMIIIPYYMVAKKLFKPNSFAMKLFIVLNLIWFGVLFALFIYIVNTILKWYLA